MTTDTKQLRVAMAEVSARVEAAMYADLDIRLTGSDQLLREVVEYALFSGGKRIRPFLCVLGSRCCGRDDTDLYILAAAFEYLHTATLMHDDVVDHASLRRGRETVVQRYSLEDAILAGDWLHAHSLYVVGKLTGADGLDIFCAATEAMVNGEFVQKRLSGDCRASEEEYFAVVRQKTGNLIASSCALGALYAGAECAKVQSLQHYGEQIGIAFQIVDDLLDYTGKGESTGKELGNDFKEGKVTLPLIRTLESADSDERRRIVKLMQGNRTAPGAQEAIVSYMHRLGGFQSAAKTAQSYIDRAIQALAPFTADPAACLPAALLHELASFILVRQK
ncbi:MAG: polyprenyl synthetase family protein [Desulfobulbaceae bacterium]|nr:polyprenyl synthetase family protein [Desulfobulbaceae bacterium]